MAVFQALSARKRGLGFGVALLMLLGACARPRADPWPKQMNAALAGRLAGLSESARADYQAGFVNGATMLHEAQKAGIRPYQPTRSLPAQPLRGWSAPPAGVQAGVFDPASEVDPATGLVLIAASGAKGSPFAEGQVDGFGWALSAVGQGLIRPVPGISLPKEWTSFQPGKETQPLGQGAKTVRFLWAPGLVAWAYQERGFPWRHTWRAWGDAEPPAWVGLADHALWVETRGGRALALDVDTGEILRTQPAVPHEPARSMDWESYQKEVLRAFNEPEFQNSLAALRKAAESGTIPDCLAVARKLSGMGEAADREAFTWFLKAAEKGSPEAMLRVGVLLFHGLSAPVDREGAKRWMARAIQAGNPDAAAVLETLFRDHE
jgi:hypothetical protein